MGTSQSKIGFRTLWDRDTSTFTYLLWDTATKEALLIDPVIEHVDRDAKVLRELGLTLKLGLNTHCHADHATGTGLLKKQFPGMKSVIGAPYGDEVMADVKVGQGEMVTLGNVRLEVRETPGHTVGCVTYVLQDEAGEPKAAFTGDALLVRGCGRTDFQGGSARDLYQSVHAQILSLPPATAIYPGHDYRGQTESTVGEELKYNPRLTKSLEDFVDLMDNLGLPYPRKIDDVLPLNKVCGLHDLLPEEEKAKRAAAAAAAPKKGAKQPADKPAAAVKT